MMDTSEAFVATATVNVLCLCLPDAARPANCKADYVYVPGSYVPTPTPTATPLPPTGHTVTLTVQAPGTIADYTDTSGIQANIASAAGVSVSDVVVTVTG